MSAGLFATGKGLEAARGRTASDARFRPVLERLGKQVDALAASEMPVFERDWWREASRKPWQQTYSEINHHTMFAVVDPAVKASDAAILAAASTDEDARRQAQRVLKHYTGYEFFAEHPDVGLNWSVWCMRLLQAYDLAGDGLPEADRKAVDGFFSRASAAVMANDQWWIRENPGGLYNNHFAWHKLMIAAYGLKFGQPNLVDYALESDQGVRDLIEQGSRDDGLWLESSLNYHFTALAPLVQLAGLLRNAEHPLDLWNHEFANGRSLRALVMGPLQAVFPDRTLPTIGDCYGRRADLSRHDIYYAAYDAYRLPGLAWLLADRQDVPADALLLESLPEGPGRPPAMTTRLWPEHGYISLRTEEEASYWNGEGFSVFFSRDLDSIHSHRDKLSLTVFGRGKHLAVDPEALASEKHAFSAQVQAELNRTTLCHNTVMIDGQDHGGLRELLPLIDYVDADDVKLATAADMRGLVYPGVKLMRTLAVAPEFVLDIFQVSCDSERQIDYLFHTAADSGAFEGADGLPPYELPSGGPWKWLRNARGRAEDGDWSATARQGEVTMRLTMAGAPGTQAVLCQFPAKDDFSGTPWPMLLARRRAKQTVFALLMQAERSGFPDTQLRLEEGRHGTLRVTVQFGSVTREFTVRELG